LARGLRSVTNVEALSGGRLALLAIAIFATFAIFLSRLFQLQIAEGDDLRRQSERNSIRTVRIDAPRGELLDREGRVIATTRPAFQLEVIPSELRRPATTFEALGRLLQRDSGELRARVGQPRGRARFQPISLAGDMSFEELARVETHRFALPGVVTEARPRREYPDGDLAGHVVGALGEIRADQLEAPRFEGYQQGDVIGQSGIEAVAEQWLRGVAGGRNVIVNVAGREVDRLDEVEPVPGDAVVLSLDLDLQREAVAAFQLSPAEAKAEVAEPGITEKLGALVALDPRTGEILALVSRPSYDPSAFAGGGIDPKVWRELTHGEWKPLQDRAISGQFPPGSTYKAFVAAAALQEGIITPQTRFFCPGSFAYGNRVYRCWRKEGHGSVDLHTALVRSCDVYFYEVGKRLGVDRIAHFAKMFGLGRTTGIDLPEEKPGLIPTSDWKKQRFGEPWMGGETISISIGQGYDLVTPLQLAVSYGAIATGRAMQPHLLKRVEKPDGTVVSETQPKVLSEVGVKPEFLAAVQSGLRGVVEEPGGTGGRARVPGVSVAGKTGTAQVIRLDANKNVPEEKIPLRYRDHAWFVSWAPVEAPEIVVAVLAEHGGHGGAAAAPIAQRVLAKYFEKKKLAVPATETAGVDGGSITAQVHPAAATPAPKAAAAAPAPKAAAAPQPAAGAADEPEAGDGAD
jgi:penicillin-binding protein 2